jgi:DNA-binding transcriptional ArsR family regulator
VITVESMLPIDPEIWEYARRDLTIPQEHALGVLLCLAFARRTLSQKGWGIEDPTLRAAEWAQVELDPEHLVGDYVDEWLRRRDKRTKRSDRTRRNRQGERTRRAQGDEVRRRIVNILRLDPGLTRAQLQQRSGCGKTQTTHHLALLEAARLVERRGEGPHTRWYAPGFERAQVIALRPELLERAKARRRLPQGVRSHPYP